MLPMYRNCPRSRLPVAEDMYARCINLPSSPFLAASEQRREQELMPRLVFFTIHSTTPWWKYLGVAN